jgi:hypothetical protein
MMLRHRVGTVCLAALALCAFPREGSAHILDIIWEMSGPQMIGIVSGCDYDKTNKLKCRVVDKVLGRPAVQRDWGSFWIAIDSTLYFSTGKDSATLETDAFKTGMVAVEPMLMTGSLGSGGDGFSLYHGAGASYDVLFGQGFSAFDKFGFKFQPIGFKYYNLTVAYIMRTYHNGFTPDEFGVGDRQDDVNRPFELVHGITAGFRW